MRIRTMLLTQYETIFVLAIQADSGCCDAPTKDVDEITRDMIILYDVEFTKTDRLNSVSRVNIIETLKKQSPEIYEKIPFLWKESGGKNATHKRKSRTR